MSKDVGVRVSPPARDLESLGLRRGERAVGQRGEGPAHRLEVRRQRDRQAADRQDPVEITAPGPGGSGLAGDTICDTKNHGGADQAVYAYASEDLAMWSAELGRTFGPGAFGENLTTIGLDVTGARIGERWQVGTDCILQVTCPRVPCRTFAVWLGDQGWIRTFTARAVPGAYLRVIQPGRVASGDPITIVHRPAHDVTIGLSFRALTGEPALLPASSFGRRRRDLNSTTSNVERTAAESRSAST